MSQTVTLPAAFPPDAHAPAERKEQEALRSEQLFRERRAVPIVHNGECYWLRLTRLGKLILTK